MGLVSLFPKFWIHIYIIPIQDYLFYVDNLFESLSETGFSLDKYEYSNDRRNIFSDMNHRIEKKTGKEIDKAKLYLLNDIKTWHDMTFKEKIAPNCYLYFNGDFKAKKNAKSVYLHQIKGTDHNYIDYEDFFKLECRIWFNNDPLLKTQRMEIHFRIHEYEMFDLYYNETDTLDINIEIHNLNLLLRLTKNIYNRLRAHFAYLDYELGSYDMSYDCILDENFESHSNTYIIINKDFAHKYLTNIDYSNNKHVHDFNDSSYVIIQPTWIYGFNESYDITYMPE